MVERIMNCNIKDKLKPSSVVFANRKTTILTISARRHHSLQNEIYQRGKCMTKITHITVISPDLKAMFRLISVYLILRLYNQLCRLDGRCVGNTLLLCLPAFLASLLLLKFKCILYHCPCPPTWDLSSCVCGLVHSQYLRNIRAQKKGGQDDKIFDERVY